MGKSKFILSKDNSEVFLWSFLVKKNSPKNPHLQITTWYPQLSETWWFDNDDEDDDDGDDDDDDDDDYNDDDDDDDDDLEGRLVQARGPTYNEQLLHSCCPVFTIIITMTIIVITSLMMMMMMRKSICS